MNRELELMRAVALAADGFYGTSKEFGERAAKCFSGDKGKSQIRNLETLANSTLKVSDVLDYIKKQVGRDNLNSPAWTLNAFGRDLLAFLEDELGKQAGGLAGRDQPSERQRVHLQLIQQFVKQLSAQYEFSRKGAQPTR